MAKTGIYYITVHNENYDMPGLPPGCEEGIVKGIYKFNSREVAVRNCASNCLAAARFCAALSRPKKSC